MEMNNIYLPCEVISNIFRFLTVSDLKWASLVCRCWHEVSDDIHLWRNVKICIFTRQAALSKSLLSSIKRKHIQHVKFRPACTASHVMQLCSKIGPHLISLDLEGCRCLGGTDSVLITNIMKTCTSLQELNLSGCRQLDMNVQYKWMVHSHEQLLNLECLILNSCKNSILSFFEVLIDGKFEKLKRLGISGCLTDNKMWKLLPEKCPSLCCLDISRCEITDMHLIALASSPKLQLLSLNLTACKQITSQGFDKLFEAQTSLRSLKLGCTEITTASICKMAQCLKDLKELELNSCRQIKVFGASAEFLSQLEYLNLYSCYQVTSAVLTKSFAGPKLDNLYSCCMKHLVLNGCSLLSDEALEKITLALPNMEHLDLGSCLQITDRGIRAVATCLTHLKVLRISWCSRVTDEGILGLEETEKNSYQDTKSGDKSAEKERTNKMSGLKDLKKLESLDVSHCSGLTDEGLVAFTKLSSLTELNLSMCVQMTDVSLTMLAHGLPSLQVLSLSGCSNLSEDGLKTASAKLQRLKFLDLSRCDCVTDASLMYIAKHCRSLTHLDLSMCSEVINYGVDELEMNLAQLASLHLRYSGVRTAAFLN